MVEEKTKLSVIFDGIKETSCGLNKIYYHKSYPQSNGRSRTIGFTAIVENEMLLERLKNLKPETPIEVEITTRFENDEMTTILSNFSRKAAIAFSNSANSSGVRIKAKRRVAGTNRVSYKS